MSSIQNLNELKFHDLSPFYKMLIQFVFAYYQWYVLHQYFLSTIKLGCLMQHWEGIRSSILTIFFQKKYYYHVIV